MENKKLYANSSKMLFKGKVFGYDKDVFILDNVCKIEDGYIKPKSDEFENLFFWIQQFIAESISSVELPENFEYYNYIYSSENSKHSGIEHMYVIHDEKYLIKFTFVFNVAGDDSFFIVTKGEILPLTMVLNSEEKINFYRSKGYVEIS